MGCGAGFSAYQLEKRMGSKGVVWVIRICVKRGSTVGNGPIRLFLFCIGKAGNPRHITSAWPPNDRHHGWATKFQNLYL